MGLGAISRLGVPVMIDKKSCSCGNLQRLSLSSKYGDTVLITCADCGKQHPNATRVAQACYNWGKLDGRTQLQTEFKALMRLRGIGD